MPRLNLLPIVVLGACVTQDVVEFGTKARFATYPKRLFAALEASCADPADTFRRPARDTVECRSYLAPSTTAALIIEFDGTTEKLPQLVLRFEAARETPGYVVNYDAYIDVPQSSGPGVRVSQQGPEVSRRMAEIFTVSGGQPEPLE